MRKRWVQIDGELVPIDRLQKAPRKGPFILGDIKPYQAVTGDMAGKWITSRAEHRAFLRRNNLEEVGNEKSYFTRYGGKSPDNPTLMNDEQYEEHVCQSLKESLQKLKG